MSKGKVLIIEDEEDISSLLALYLKKEGFLTEIASDGTTGLQKFKESTPKVVILDLMLPDIDGLEVCRQIRKDDNTPIIMLTAKDSEIDKVVGLEVGADDYVTKPFSPREVLARIKAILRRLETGSPQKVLQIGDLVIDPGKRSVIFKEKSFFFTPKEFDLLFYLAENKGLVLSREQILAHVWGYDYLGDTRTVDVHVRQIRNKLGPDSPLKTVWGVGYKINDV